MRRVIWFCVLPLAIANAALWLVGRALESLGDALQQGANAIRDEVSRWGRLLFSVKR